jgi:hypothetical protein
VQAAERRVPSLPTVLDTFPTVHVSIKLDSEKEEKAAEGGSVNGISAAHAVELGTVEVHMHNTNLSKKGFTGFLFEKVSNYILVDIPYISSISCTIFLYTTYRTLSIYFDYK